MWPIPGQTERIVRVISKKTKKCNYSLKNVGILAEETRN